MIPDRHRGILYSWGIRPAGAGRGFPAAGGDGGYPAAGRGRRRAVPACLGMHPPIFFSPGVEKRKRAVHGPKEKRRFWWLRKSPAAVESPGKVAARTHGCSSLPALRAWPAPGGEEGVSAAFYEGAPSEAIPLRGRWRGRPPFNSRLCLLIRQRGATCQLVQSDAKIIRKGAESR